jgi:hypothetical protein
MEADENKGDRIFHEVVETSITLNKMAVAEVVEARWDMLHSDLHSAAYILNPRYLHTHDFSGT